MHRQSEKNLLNSNTSSTCPDNMVNFSLLTAEICWQVWGTPSNFNGFHVLAALLHGSGHQPNFAALNRGRHLYLAGRSSRWALAHISSFLVDLKWHRQSYYDAFGNIKKVPNKSFNVNVTAVNRCISGCIILTVGLSNDFLLITLTAAINLLIVR